VIEALIRPAGQYQPHTALVSIENTHNFCNGSALSASYSQEIADLAHEHGAALHIDGARIFNAAIALETTAKDLVKAADSVSFCLSKGLACPVGSLICGTGDFIYEARRQRRMVGGGMRQVGILAAAGIVALDEMVDRLADDHANARALVEGLATVLGIKVHPELVQTNILFFEPDGVDGVELSKRLQERGVLCTGSTKRFRVVTHYGIEREDVEYAVEVVREVVASL
jgi:threonine aldolase